VILRSVLRVGRIVLGVACLLVGVAGLFLPFIQGILLLVIGLALLGKESERARRLSDWLRSYLPRRQAAKLGEPSDGLG